MNLAQRDLLKIALFVLLFYVPPGFFLYSHSVSNVFEEEVRKSKQQLVEVVELINSLSFAGASAEACEQLRSEVRAGRISFYSLESRDLSCAVPEGMSLKDYPVKASDRFTSFKVGDVEYTGILLRDESFSFIAGSMIPTKKDVGSYLMSDGSALATLLMEIGLVLWCIIGFVILIVSRNLEKIKHSLVGTGNRTPWYITFVDRFFGWLSIEQLDSVAAVADESARKLAHLLRQNEYEEKNLQYSVMRDLKGQLEKGESPSLPVSFHGVVARVDINGYSNLMRSLSASSLKSVSTSFKGMAAELAYRYGGLFESTAGDEVVYVFRGRQAMFEACAFVRDLSKDFTAVKFSDGHGGHFSLYTKGSLSESEITMDFGPSKVEFDGLAFLHSNRMLGAVKKKDRNVLVVSPDDAKIIGDLTSVVEETREDIVKGMQIVFREIVAFIPLNSAPKYCERFYRSDSDIIQMLHSIRASERPMEIIGLLFGISRIRSISSSCKDAWVEAVNGLAMDTSFTKKHAEVLPSLITYVTTLVPHNLWDASCASAIKRIMDSDNSRAIENSIEALTKFKEFDEIAGLHLPSSISNRLRANILVAQIISTGSSNSFNSLFEMMTSKNQEERRSGFFAGATALILLRKSSDITIFGKSEYLKLLKLLKRSLKRTEDLGPRVEGLVRVAVK